MSSSSSNNSGGIGFVGLLTIVFITLKLIHQIDWSWWWVLSPIWISAGIIVLILLIAGLVMLAASLIDKRRARRRRQLKAAAVAMEDYAKALQREEK